MILAVVAAALIAVGIGGWRAFRKLERHIDEHGLPDDAPDL